MTRSTQIEKRLLGKSGIAVSVIGLGLWAIGGDYWGPIRYYGYGLGTDN